MNDDELRQALATLEAYKNQLNALTQQSQLLQMSFEETVRASHICPMGVGIHIVGITDPHSAQQKTVGLQLRQMGKDAVDDFPFHASPIIQRG